MVLVKIKHLPGAFWDNPKFRGVLIDFFFVLEVVESGRARDFASV